MKSTSKIVFFILIMTLSALACNLSGGEKSPTPNLGRQPVGIPSPTPSIEPESSDDEQASVNTSGDSQSNESSDTVDTVQTDCTVRTDWPMYRVVEGDTLGSIARRTGSSTTALAQANCLADPNNIHVGQQLVVPNLPQTSSNSSSGSTTDNIPTQFTALVESVDVEAGTVRVLTGQENTFSTLQVVQDGQTIPIAFESGSLGTIHSFEVWQEVFVEGHLIPGNPTDVIPESILIKDVNPRSGVGPFYLENIVVESIDINNRWMRVSNAGDVQTVMIKAAVPENTWAEVFLADGTEVSLNSLRQGSRVTVNGYRWVGDHYAVEIILLEE